MMSEKKVLDLNGIELNLFLSICEKLNKEMKIPNTIREVEDMIEEEINNLKRAMNERIEYLEFLKVLLNRIESGEYKR